MGNYLTQPICSKHSQAGATERFSYAASSMQGWRLTMEDAHLMYNCIDQTANNERIYIFGVYDGHGGADVSKFAAHTIVEELRKCPQYHEGEYEIALKVAYCNLDRILKSTDWLDDLNAKIRGSDFSRKYCFYDQGHQKPSSVSFVHDSCPCEDCRCPMPMSCSQAGCTEDGKTIDSMLSTQPVPSPSIFESLYKLVSKKITWKTEDSKFQMKNKAVLSGCTALTLLIVGEDIYVANAGDSRAVLCREGQAEPLSFDHKPTNTEERERIYQAGGYVEFGRINGNLNLSRAIGDLVYKQDTLKPPERQIVSAFPDIIKKKITAKDEFIIMGCDGIWEYNSGQDVVDYVRSRMMVNDNMPLILEELFDSIISPNPSMYEYGCDNMTSILINLRPFLNCACKCHEPQRLYHTISTADEYEDVPDDDLELEEEGFKDMEGFLPEQLFDQKTKEVLDSLQHDKPEKDVVLPPEESAAKVAKAQSLAKLGDDLISRASTSSPLKGDATGDVTDSIVETSFEESTVLSEPSDRVVADDDRQTSDEGENPIPHPAAANTEAANPPPHSQGSSALSDSDDDGMTIWDVTEGGNTARTYVI